MHSPRHARRLGALAIAAALTTALAACSPGASQSPSSATASSGGSAAAPSVNSSGTVNVGAKEFAFDPSAIVVKAGTVTFKVKNTGVAEHEFEIFKGTAVVDEIEGLVPGLEKELKVDLAAGDYTFVCKLPGHEEAGMKGTLSVVAG